jgi:nitrate reductase / nitrite oxidoreductase, alpha subunit
VVEVGLPYFGGIATPHFTANVGQGAVNRTRVPAVRLRLGKEGEERHALVATVFDLQAAQYGIDRGLGSGAKSYDDDAPYTPAWAESITGVPRDQIVTVARQFADNADKTHGKSMIIIGAAMNHWYHADMNYRGVINLLMMCGCVGQSGGGWAHYVGQEKLRPQTGWTALAFALDWIRPPRQQNSTSFFYAHTDQWRYEKLGMEEIVSPLADKSVWGGSMIDYNVRAERMGWLPSAPQLKTNPLQVVKDAQAAGLDPKDYVVRGLKDGTLQMSCEDPDAPQNWPRNLFVWRSNLLGSSGKGHEYFCKHLLGTENGVQGKDLGQDDAKPAEVKWHEQAPEGKLDLLVTLDFRMSTTCLYSDIVLPTASWYEKNDLNTSDMHPFIHPLSAAVDPVWQSRSDWEIYKGFAKAFSEVCVGHLGVESEVVLTPLMHDTPAELAQPFDVKEWKKGQCELIPGKTAPQITVVARDYPNTYKRFTALGPLMNKVGNGGKGIGVEDRDRGHAARPAQRADAGEGVTQGMPKIVTDIDACEVILQLAPETNGHVAVKAWEALEKATGREHKHLALYREDEKIRYRDVQAQPRKIISSPTWSGIESETVSYNAGYTNVHELIPWRTLSGRQQFYQDHPWMIAFGEALSQLPPAGGPEDHQRHPQHQGQRQPGDPAQLHHAAPEVGHPQHLQRQPDDADAQPRRHRGLAQRGRREKGRHRRQRLGRALQHQRRRRGARGGQPARQPRHGDDVPLAGEDHQHAGLGDHRRARRHPQQRDAHRAQAHAHDRRLRAAELRLQLLRNHRHQPRRVRGGAQDGQGRLAGHAARRPPRSRLPGPGRETHEPPSSLAPLPPEGAVRQRSSLINSS